MVDIIEGGITTPCGFSAAGVHSGVKYRSPDLGMVRSEVPARVFCAYTSNTVKAAPVQVMIAEDPQTLTAVVVNSGNANALTGKRGIEDVMTMKRIAASEVGVEPEQVGVMSTGLIGRFLDMQKVGYGISRAAKELRTGRDPDTMFAKAITTTDKVLKECAARVRLQDGSLVHIGAVTKGSGMIAPQMKALHATTLTLITTDANLSPGFAGTWQSVLDDSMNMVSVDGDQSTNDTSILMANGMSGSLPADDDPGFVEALREVTVRLARMIATDGEGATKLIEVRVTGAATKDDARRLVRRITNSPLVKTAIFGADPNYGRIMAAVGSSGAEYSPEGIRLAIRGGSMEVPILEGGSPVFQEERTVEAVRMAMDHDEIVILVDLASGTESAVGWGCDLSYEYVRINAEYTT